MLLFVSSILAFIVIGSNYDLYTSMSQRLEDPLKYSKAIHDQCASLICFLFSCCYWLNHSCFCDPFMKVSRKPVWDNLWQYSVLTTEEFIAVEGRV